MTNEEFENWRLKILKNPTLESARQFWDFCKMGIPETETTPLAGVHKARLVHPKMNKKQKSESKKWLKENGYIPEYLSPFGDGKSGN